MDRIGVGLQGYGTGHREELGPLSPHQEGLWLHQQLVGPAVFNLPVCLRLRGPLDTSALHRALQQVTTRHDALRTSFHVLGRRPMARVRPVVMVPLNEVVVDDDEESLARAIAAELSTPFDLARPPLMRSLLYRIGNEHHVLLIVMHHLICDDHSIGLLLSELEQHYNHALAGRPPPPMRTGLLSLDLAIRAQKALTRERRELLVGRARSRLEGAPHVIRLPMDHRSPEGGIGRSLVHHSSPALVGQVRDFARQLRVTPFVAMLAAFRLLLWRQTGESDVLVGVPMTTRDLGGSDQVMGFFMNLIVVRNRLRARKTFIETVRDEHEAALGAFDDRGLPFADVVNALCLRRERRGLDLVQVTFSQRIAGGLGVKLDSLDVEEVAVSGAGTHWPLSLDVAVSPAGLMSHWGFDGGFDACFMAATATRFETLLDGVVTDPDQPIASLDALTEEDSAMVASLHTTTSTARPIRSVYGRFQTWSTLQPRAVAVRYQESQRTYGDVEELAGQVRSSLRKLAPLETPVAVLMERGPDLPGVLLGVLSAGCSVVALDPELPERRIEESLAASGATVVITDASRAASPWRAAVIVVDGGAVTRHDGCDVDVCRESHRDQLAYVTFTSGTTGRPKAVAVSHAGLENCFEATLNALQPLVGARLLAISSIAFDIAILELLLPLLSGGEVIITGRGDNRDGRRLRSLLERWRPAYLHATPAVWQMILDAAWSGDPALTVLCGGDVVPVELARELQERTAGLLHLYGPSEATMYCVADAVTDSRSLAELPRLPIGRPIPGVDVTIVDETLRPVAPGAIGELCVGGACLARGYLGQPAETARRFVPDPLATEDGRRVYRTGDLARMRADGRLELHGRQDDQVKIRGHRIELGGIEQVLSACPNVAQAAVAVADRGTPYARLLGFVTLATGAGGPDPGVALRQHLTQQLPREMIPAVVHVVDVLPVTANGKVDRSRLLADAAQANRHWPGAPPFATVLEQTIAHVWADVLGIATLTRTSDFFQLGGNSLLAMEVIGHLGERLEVELGIDMLFDSPTIEELALRVTEVCRARREPFVTPPS